MIERSVNVMVLRLNIDYDITVTLGYDLTVTIGYDLSVTIG